MGNINLKSDTHNNDCHSLEEWRALVVNNRSSIIDTLNSDFERKKVLTSRDTCDIKTSIDLAPVHLYDVSRQISDDQFIDALLSKDG